MTVFSFLAGKKNILADVYSSSEFMNKTINEWLINTSSSNRKIFVDGVFELFYSSGSESFRELSKSWTKDVPKMFNAYKSISKEDRKVMMKMFKEFNKAVGEVFKESSHLKMSELKEKVQFKKDIDNDSGK